MSESSIDALMETVESAESESEMLQGALSTVSVEIYNISQGSDANYSKAKEKITEGLLNLEQIELELNIAQKEIARLEDY